MDAIDYYRDFINIIPDNRNEDYCCNYLYILKDKLEGPTKITTFQDEISIGDTVPKGLLDRNIYILFIPYNRYILALKVEHPYNTTNLCYSLFIYNKKQYITTFISSDVKNIINFLRIDKLTEAREFITTTLYIMYNAFTNMKTNRYISKYKLLMRKSIDCYMQLLPQIFDKDEYYIIRANVTKESYLNIRYNKYTFNRYFKGTCAGLIYYFEIDNERSIFIIAEKCQDLVTICYYFDGKVIFNDIAFCDLQLELRMMLNLLNRKDIYRYLQQMQFFKRKVFFLPAEKIS